MIIILRATLIIPSPIPANMMITIMIEIAAVRLSLKKIFVSNHALTDESKKLASEKSSISPTANVNLPFSVVSKTAR